MLYLWMEVNIMNRLFNNKGLTLIEVIMTLAILGLVICPLMNMLVLSEKINKEGHIENKSIQTAQYYMEEIRDMDEIDMGAYVYNPEKMCYERIITGIDNYTAEIRIRIGNYGLHYIEVDILKEGKVINSLKGSVVFE